MRRATPRHRRLRRLALLTLVTGVLLALAPALAAAAPAPPTNLAGVAGSGGVSLMWTPSTSMTASGYWIYRDGAIVGSVSGATTGAFLDTTAPSAATHSYAVVSVDWYGTASAPSNTLTVRMPGTADGTAPGAPSGLSATPGNGQVALSWLPASDNVGVARYDVYRDGALVGSPAATGFLDTGLANGTSHVYTVRAVDAAGNASAASGSATAAPFAPVDASAPSTPSGLAAAAGDRQVQLSWVPASDDVGVSGYRVYRDGGLVGSAAGSPFTDSGLTNGVAISYTVRAIDAAGNLSSASSSVIATPVAALSGTAPTAPTALDAQAGDGQVTLRWAAATDDLGVTGYRVYRGGSLIASPSATTYTDTGLANGTSYAYAVRAVDAAGTLSPSSATATAIPVAAVAGGGSVVCDLVASPSGSDGNPGTLARPLASVQKLDQALGAGQTGCLRQGSYATASSQTRFSNPAGVTIRSYPGERATLNGWPYINGAGTTLSYMDFDLNNVNNYTTHCAPIGGTAQQAFSLQIAASNVTIEHANIHQDDVPYQLRAVGIGAGWENHITGLTIRNNRIHDVGHCPVEDHGIYLDDVDGAQITGNWLYDLPGGAGVQLWSRAAHVHVAGNIIDQAASGIIVGAGRGTPTNNNLIAYNIITNMVGTPWPIAAPDPVPYTGPDPGVPLHTYWDVTPGPGNTFQNNLTHCDTTFAAHCTTTTNATGITQSATTTADPHYRNPATHDYRLTTTSPATTWGTWNGDLD